MITASRVPLREACQLLGMSKRQLWLTAGRDNTFPVMIRVPNGKGIVFEAEEIHAWRRANPRTMTHGVMA